MEPGDLSPGGKRKKPKRPSWHSPGRRWLVQRVFPKNVAEGDPAGPVRRQMPEGFALGLQPCEAKEICVRIFVAAQRTEEAPAARGGPRRRVAPPFRLGRSLAISNGVTGRGGRSGPNWMPSNSGLSQKRIWRSLRPALEPWFGLTGRLSLSKRAVNPDLSWTGASSLQAS
jgi:hypothetical protein